MKYDCGSTLSLNGRMKYDCDSTLSLNFAAIVFHAWSDGGREVAAEYHYSYGYVKNVITRIFSKLEVEKRRDLRKMFEG